ncbi:MAG: disulfide bond formation protein B [Gammaproteobacteria bacterium]|nr:disulfide bond formation protein B [Gammaproteobacteria bacterium]
MTLLKRLKDIQQGHVYWLVYIAGSLLLMAAAMYFQYIREEPPCLMCIQVRLLLSLLIFIAVIGLLTRRHPMMNVLANISTVLVALSMSERAYQLLGTERGFVFSDCGFDLGLPVWLALDEWLPWLFRVQTTCGYTPEIVFGITIAESLMVLSILLLAFSACMTLLSLLALKK